MATSIALPFGNYQPAQVASSNVGTNIAQDLVAIPPEAIEHLRALSCYRLEQVITWLQYIQRTDAEQTDQETQSLQILPPTAFFYNTHHAPRASVASTDSRFSRASSTFTRSSFASSRTSNSVGPQVGTGRTSRPDGNQGKYVCSHCDVKFKRCWDWKFHEETFHERWRRFDCPQCNQQFWNETKFNQHHKTAHGCQECPHAGHAQGAEVQLRKRNAWGCGYCPTGVPLLDWNSRCKHIAEHMEKGEPKTAWKQSNVILGLLHQPKFERAWKTFVFQRHGEQPVKWCWARRDTAELQEALEYSEYTQHDIAALVERAYELGHTPSRSGSQKDNAVEISGSPEGFANSSETLFAQPAIVNPHMSFMQGIHEEPCPSKLQISVSPQPTAMDIDHYIPFNATAPAYENDNQQLAHNHYFPAQRTQYVDKDLPPLPMNPPSNLMVNNGPNSGVGQLQLDSFHFENWGPMTTTIVEDTYLAHQPYA